MKNHRHLNNLVELLQGLDLRSVPSLVIDDEADQAGLNTLVNQNEESRTYQRLLSLRGALPHHTYVQYTATPQAPLLINIIDVLSPRFVEVLDPGREYVGVIDFFQNRRALVRTIPDDEIPSPDNQLNGAPESLREALRLVHRRRRRWTHFAEPREESFNARSSIPTAGAARELFSLGFRCPFGMAAFAARRKRP